MSNWWSCKMNKVGDGLPYLLPGLLCPSVDITFLKVRKNLVQIPACLGNLVTGGISGVNRLGVDKQA